MCANIYNSWQFQLNEDKSLQIFKYVLYKFT